MRYIIAKSFAFLLLALVAIPFVISALSAAVVVGGALLGFAVVVAAWALFIYAEQLVRYGYREASFLEAVEEAATDVFQAIRGSFVKLQRRTIAQTVADFRKSLTAARLRVSAGVVVLPVFVLVAFVAYGIREVRQDLKGTFRSIRNTWAGAYL